MSARRAAGVTLGAVALLAGGAVLGAVLTPDRAPVAPVPAAPAAPNWVPAGTPPCATEDASGPCYWDAASRGNGVGRSFLVSADGAVRVVSAPVPAPGSVLGSDGRVVTLDEKGCLFLTYGAAYGVPESDYDPGDGEWFCAT